MTTIIIEYLNASYIRVTSEPSVEAELSDFFTYDFPGARYTPSFKAKIWDGKVRLFCLMKKTIYAGLVCYVEEFAKRGSHHIEYKGEKRQEININSILVKKYADSLNLYGRGKPITIHDYQIDAVTVAINSERRLLLAPTASGKSLIIYTLMRWYIEQGLKCILIIPTTALVEQMFTDFQDYSSQNGFDVEANCQKLYSGFTKNFTKSVLISTWQSIYLQPKSWFGQFNVIFGDEAHGCKSNSLVSLMSKMEGAHRRIGTTGTIDSTKINKLVIEGLFGPVHKVISTKTLMETNRVSQLNITCLILKYPEELRKSLKHMDYGQEMNWLISNPDRNNFIKNIAIKSKGNTLVLFQFVEKHGDILYKIIKEAAGEGRKVFYIHGGTNVKDREIVRELVKNETNALIIASFGVFAVGTNIPSIKNIIFTSPSKSKIRNLQSIGRGLRLDEGKTECNLYDLADDLSYKKHKNFTLKHAAERYKIYTEEEFKIKIMEINIW